KIWTQDASHAFFTAPQTRDGTHVVHKELAVICDVQVQHLKSANAILRCEGSVFYLLHGELVGAVAHVLGASVEDGVIVATAEFDGDRAGNSGRNPTCERVLQEHAFWVEPAAFIEQSSQTSTERVVLVESVFVVDGRKQALVPNMEQRHARRFVDATAFGVNDAIFNLITHPETMTTSHLVGFEHHLNEFRKAFPIDGDGYPALEFQSDFFR